MPKGLRGKLAVGQSGGPTVVLNSSLAGVLDEATRHSEIENIYGLVNGIEGALFESLVDLTNCSPDFLHMLSGTPAAILGSCRKNLFAEDYERIVRVFAAHNIHYFLYAGGNGSMETAYQVAQMARALNYELVTIGIPKTVDNDIPFTDHCPGYGTIARFMAWSIRDSGLDQRALRTFVPILITEAMGRHTGWIAAASVLAKASEADAPHLVYVPERPFDEGKFVTDAQECYHKFGWASVVVSEGIKDAEGTLLGGKDAPEDRTGRRALPLGSGVAQYLARVINRETGLLARVNRPGSVARSLSAVVSAVDRREAEDVGRFAVRQAVQGNDGVMVTLERASGSTYHCTLGTVALARVANAEKILPAAFISPNNNMIEADFGRYALPLIGDALPPLAQLTQPLVERLA